VPEREGPLAAKGAPPGEELAALVDLWREVVESHDRAPLWRSSLALLMAQCGRYEEAATEFEDLVADNGADLPLDRDWLPTVAAMGEVAAALNDGRAPLLANLLLPYARRLIVVGPGLACRGSVGRVLGLLYAASGMWNQAERHFQAALTAHETAAAVALLARTRSDFGRALATKPGGPLHVGRVRTTLEQAAKEAARCRMTRLVAEIRSTRRRVA
jgi:tetratricopeptide (TPR) repeat protein